MRFLGLGHHAQLFQLINQSDNLGITGYNFIILLHDLSWLVLGGVLMFHGLVVCLHFIHCLHVNTLQPILNRRRDSVVEVFLLLLFLAIVVQDGHES